jgi:hypothetical protein
MAEGNGRSSNNISYLSYIMRGSPSITQSALEEANRLSDDASQLIIEAHCEVYD